MKSRRIGSNDSGSISVEAALALPLLLAITLGAVDLAVYGNVKTTMDNAASEAIRGLSINALTSADAQSLILDRMSVWTASATSSVSTSGDELTVTVTVPTSDIPVAGIINIFDSRPTLVASATAVKLD
jgi:Flp pilus assembly protein TadG